jgi:hypothetical protein
VGKHDKEIGMMEEESEFIELHRRTILVYEYLRRIERVRG